MVTDILTDRAPKTTLDCASDRSSLRVATPTDGPARSGFWPTSLARTYRASEAGAGQGTADRICLAAEAVAGAECDGSAMERAETRCGCKPLVLLCHFPLAVA